jgi:A/G-specific adenine glycosylase
MVVIMPPVLVAKKPVSLRRNRDPADDLADDLAGRLLAWYDIHRRILPWRASRPRQGEKPKRADPYRVWLSEIMLQQTTVQAVAGYYRKFLAKWPDVKALAAAGQDEVLAAWAGLGYYARARNLHAAAKLVAGELDGKFPGTAEGLRQLPGIGGYTAGAIAAIAYDETQAAMDANAERVIARVYAIATPMPKAKSELHILAQALVPDRAGDFAQALMDLGSAICTPKRPACGNCPWTDDCLARRRGIQESLPVKAPKRARPLKRGAAFVARDQSGAVLLVKRPDKGLLAAMLEPPLGPWGEEFPSKAAAIKQAPFKAAWKKRPGIVRHGFTHFELEIEVYVAEVSHHPKLSWPAPGPREARPKGKLLAGHPHLPLSCPHPGPRKARPECKLHARHPGDKKLEVRWVARNDLSNVALPTVMRKIVEHGLDEGGPLFAAARPKKTYTSSARKR